MMWRRTGFVVLAVSLFFLLGCNHVVLAGFSTEGSFDRTLKVSGAVDLEVKTGSGRISVRSGPPGTVTVHGTIRASDSWGGGMSPEDKVKRLQENPPIEQSGNSIHIGYIRDEDLRRNVSISYEVVAPADTRLQSHTGSGSQSIEGLKGPVEAHTGSGSIKMLDIGAGIKASTGSGSIELDNIQGSVRASTGSGSIRAGRVGGGLTASTGSGNVTYQQAAAGSVEVETGSGNVAVENVKGSLRAETGSGRIEAGGDPSGSWELHTGSGGVTVRLPSQAAFDLYARTSSGSISVDHPITVQGTISRREIRGKVRGGGGFNLDVRTGSGSIRVE